MQRNVIDNITEGKDVKDLFELPKVERKTIKIDTEKIQKNRSKFKIPKNMEREDLYSEKIIKKQDYNLKGKLILPLLNFNFLNNQSVKWKNGETERILASEYYNNSYKESVRIRNSTEGSKTIRNNYKMMWDFVSGYVKKKKK